MKNVVIFAKNTVERMKINSKAMKNMEKYIRNKGVNKGEISRDCC